MNVSSALQIDHIDGDGLNNTKQNLRICTQSENVMNQSIRSDNSSGYKGVWWDKQTNKWRAGIIISGKTVYLGRFDFLVNAARAYDFAAKELFGEFSKLNFPK